VRGLPAGIWLQPAKNYRKWYATLWMLQRSC